MISSLTWEAPYSDLQVARGLIVLSWLYNLWHHHLLRHLHVWMQLSLNRSNSFNFGLIVTLRLGTAHSSLVISWLNPSRRKRGSIVASEIYWDFPEMSYRLRLVLIFTFHLLSFDKIASLVWRSALLKFLVLSCGTLCTLIAFIKQLFPSIFPVFIDHLLVKVSLLILITFKIKWGTLANCLIKVELLETKWGLLLLYWHLRG